ncbi:E3 ubiquitin ISG15 ligase TRIM25-like [Pelobates cultripes]|uniref:E3 ubiquitin ISG15 ligase TRIM25-like n=1 Tax=Pelobates cultripes TaxID=61616 RepID=A0AAD1S710_PELCU|nr:E3 ubiquitin ISG15 ligase TRIM25-like [Pelobates cultripes]
MDTLNEASEKKKQQLRNTLKKLTATRGEAERRIESLQELGKEVKENAAAVTEEVTALIRDIREQLEVLEKQVLSEISRQEKQASLKVSDLIRQLEIKKEKLSRKMGHIEELCSMTDPLTVLQGQESDNADNCDAEEGDNEDRYRDGKMVRAVGDLDMCLISVTLHSGLARIVTGVKRQRHVSANILLGVELASDMLLDVNTASDILLDAHTAGNNVTVSGDMKTVSWSIINQSGPDTPERFQYKQTLSSRSFSSGRHYWEVEDSGGIIASMNQRLGIYLDYEAGRLSFYELCDPIRHIHTFTANFTEPLHAIYWGSGGFGVSSSSSDRHVTDCSECYTDSECDLQTDSECERHECDTQTVSVPDRDVNDSECELQAIVSETDNNERDRQIDSECDGQTEQMLSITADQHQSCHQKICGHLHSDDLEPLP